MQKGIDHFDCCSVRWERALFQILRGFSVLSICRSLGSPSALVCIPRTRCSLREGIATVSNLPLLFCNRIASNSEDDGHPGPLNRDGLSSKGWYPQDTGFAGNSRLPGKLVPPLRGGGLEKCPS